MKTSNQPEAVSSVLKVFHILQALGGKNPSVYPIFPND